MLERRTFLLKIGAFDSRTMVVKCFRKFKMDFPSCFRYVTSRTIRKS